MNLVRGDLEVLPDIDLIFALDKSRDAEIENYQRSSGIHISEIGHKYARKCNLFLAHALLDGDRSIGNRRWMLSRFEIGHAFHEYAYRSIRRALIDYFETFSNQYRVISIDIEKTLPTSPLGMTGTPDVVVTLERLSHPGTWIRFVIDVKSISKKQFEEKMSATGMRVPIDYKQQLQHYMEICRAHFGLVYWVCIERPFLQRQSFVGPNRRLFNSTQSRIRSVLSSLMDEGELPAPSPGAHCGQCPYNGICEASAR